MREQLEYEKDIAKELQKAIDGKQDLDKTLKFIESSHRIRRRQQLFKEVQGGDKQ